VHAWLRSRPVTYAATIALAALLAVAVSYLLNRIGF
jgi:hypothetical protein